MSTPYLERFALAVVTRLVASDLLLLGGPPEAVAGFVAAELGRDVPGRSLISTLVKALIACPEVDELFVEDEELKRLLEAMDTVHG